MSVSGAPVPMDVLVDPQACAAAWETALRRTGLSDNTKRTYSGEVQRYVGWLLEQPHHRLDEVFTDPHTRDYAVRDYRRWLLTRTSPAPRKPKGVDTAMTAVGNLYDWVGLGAPHVPSAAGQVRAAPKALSVEQTRQVLRAAERRGPRDMALVMLSVGTGLRVSEVAALDVLDVWVSARRGQVQVRAGKGDQPRTVPLNGQTQDALRAWLAVRPQQPGADSQALFLSREGNRLAVRSIRHLVGEVGKACGVDLNPHMLRHTFGTALVRGQVDIGRIGDLMGHRNLETTRVYTLPSAEDLAAAVDVGHVDF